MKYLITFLFIVSAPLLTAQDTKTVKKSGEQLKAESLVKARKYKEAIAILEAIIPTSKPDSPAGIVNKHGMMKNLAFSHLRLGNRENYKKLIQQRYEYITKAVVRFPENAQLAILRLYDMSFLASSYNIRKESDARITLNIKAVTFAEKLVAKAPNDETAKICQFNAYNDLAKSYRWNNELRSKALAVVDKGLATLNTVSNFPKYSPKAYRILQIQALKIAVLSLNKDYKKASEVSDEMLLKTKSLLTNDDAGQHQILELIASLYHNAYLQEKLGAPQDAQKRLQNLLNIIDGILKKNPNNKGYLDAKKRYSKWKGKTLK